ncbi:MAG: alginate export family protein [Myxococcota bacterium]
MDRFGSPVSARLALGAALCGPVLAAASPAGAVSLTDEVDAHFQLRTRVDRHDGRDGDSSDDPVRYVENRVRLGVSFGLDSGFGGLFQVQDVRVWGEETNTLTDYSADGLDIHQAYGDIPLRGENLVLRIGRQEIIFDGQRLVGAVGWTPQARSFDAARLTWRCKLAPISADLFYSQVFDRESIQPGPAQNTNDQVSGFGGLVGRVRLLDREGLSNRLSVYALVDTASADLDRTRYTLGLYDKGAAGMFRYRVEGYYQGGDLGGESISAFMFGARAGIDTGMFSATLWGDYLSGAEDAADAATDTFDTLFATNHKFYGFADFFINVPAHTQGKGLVDLAVKLGLKPVDGLSIGLHGHRFLAAQPRGGSADLGWEGDLVATWTPWDPVKVFFGTFVMFPGDALEARIGGDDADVGVYTSVQLDL